MADVNGFTGSDYYADPAATDNSAMVTIPVEPSIPEGSPSDSQPSGAPDVAALAARLADIEAKRERDLQQVQGSRQEVQRLQAQLQAEQEQSRRLQEQHQQFMQQLVAQRAQPQADAEPPMTLADVIEKVALNGDKDAARRFEQQQQARQAAPPQTTPQGADKPLTLRDWETLQTHRDQTTRLRDALVQDLGSRYGDVLGHPEAATLLADAYARAAQNPMLQAISADPTGVATLEWGGQRWNVHLLERAAQEARARIQAAGTQQQQQTQAAQSMPQQGGGANTARPRAGQEQVVAPRGMVELLKDPRIARAMESLTGHKDPRTQLKDVFEHVPSDMRQQWLRQAAIGRQEHQR